MAKITLSIDDGCASDLRLAELSKKYEVETVFYIPFNWHYLAYENGYNPLSYGELIDISKSFEIGSHTITHRHLTRLPFDQATQEIFDSKLMMEDMLGVEINKFCPPRGYTNPKLTDVTLEIYDSQRLTKGKHLVHVHPDSGANENKPWRRCINEDTKEIWMHSQELDRFNLWRELEEVLREITHT